MEVEGGEALQRVCRVAEGQLEGGEIGEEVVGTHTGEVLGAARCMVGFGEAV